MDITADPILQEFLNRNLKQPTKTKYTTILSHYCDSTGMTPSSLIDEAEEDEDNNVRLRKRRIKTHLENHVEYLEGKDFSYNYIQISLTAIRTFYHFFDIQLPRTRITPPTQGNVRTVDDIPSRNEIRRALSEANTKYKAIILLQISSGMGLSEVTSLQIQDLLLGCDLDPTSIDGLGDIDREKTIIKWQVTRQKTGKQYYTFSTPETTGRIMDYLDKHPPGSVDDHLFRAERGIYRGKAIQTISIPQMFIEINDRCGFGKVGRLRKFRSHALRKYFANTLESYNCPHLAIRMMMGHKVGDKVTSAYFYPDQDRLLKEYKRVMEHLTIYEKLKVIDNTDEELRSVKEDLERVKKFLRMKKEN